MSTINLNDLTKKMKGLSYGSRLHPVRDWLVLLCIVLFLLALSVLWNLWLFARVTNGENIGGETAPVATHGVNLQAVDALFEKRSQEEARYLQEYRFVDPSNVGS